MLLILMGAWAVTVTDPVDCVTAESIENELGLAFDSADLALIDVAVEVAESADSDGLFLHLAVDKNDQRIWDRVMDASPRDCPSLPKAIALSIESGLADMPGWDVPPGPALPAGIAGSAELGPSVGVRGDPRLLVGGGIRVRAFQRLGWNAAVRGLASTPFSVGDGSVVVAGLSLSTGPSLHIPVGTMNLEPAAAVGVGVLWVVGRGFDANRVARVWRVAAEAGSWFGGRQLQVGLFAELPVARVNYRVEQGESQAESALRGVLLVRLLTPGKP
jgi:hypothetical protein